MKKIICVTLIIITLISIILCCSSCQNNLTRSFGGEMTVKLPINTKLEMITWKEDSLWYLTRPMTENDIAEVHTFEESSEFGVFEGTVTIIETKGE